MSVDAAAILSHFPIEGTIKSVAPLGNGHINDSFRVETAEADKPDYVLQKINHHIFTDVDLLQNNILVCTEHIRRRLEENGVTDVDRKVLKFVIGNDGKSYYFDGTSYWRVMIYIPDSETKEHVNAEYSYRAGKAFAEFDGMLADIGKELGETIPKFHNMEFRMEQLREAVANDKSGRAQEVKDLLDAIEAKADDMCRAERMGREGKLPKRMCHCDTKVNNMLFDKNGEFLCVIDLDTLMPSFIFSDFGDFLRTAANTGEEDDKNLDNVEFNMEIFKAFTKGFLEGGKSYLTETEIEELPYAAELFPYMQCVRFLWDYIQGSTYYKIHYPEHNLVRARAQWKLFSSALAKEPEMRAFIKECLEHK